MLLSLDFLFFCLSLKLYLELYTYVVVKWERFQNNLTIKLSNEYLKKATWLQHMYIDENDGNGWKIQKRISKTKMRTWISNM